MVAVSHNKGIVKCYQYEGRINGEKFVKFIEGQFSVIFSKGNNKEGSLFLQKDDPSQNCKISREAMEKVESVAYLKYQHVPKTLTLLKTFFV